MEDLEIEVAPYGEYVRASLGRGQVDLELRSDWAGDTVSGFGEDVTQSLEKHHVQILVSWLNEALENWIDRGVA